MSNLRQAAQQALEALEDDCLVRVSPHSWERKSDLAILALKQALAEPEQEPVAWMDIDDNGQRLSVRQWSDGNSDEVPLYTAPTPRKPLTDEALHQVIRAGNYDSMEQFARAIERAHGIGEQT